MLDRVIRLLICTDLRPSADSALAQALQLAQRLRAEPHLCHITRWAALPPMLGGRRRLHQHLTPRVIESRLRLHVATLGGPPDAALQVYVRSGRAVEGILLVIAEMKPDLLVVCLHAPVLYKRLMLGSVARKLAVRSPIPIVLVPAVVKPRDG
jgi:nucleotide-binding universal stress UspA family protein